MDIEKLNWLAIVAAAMSTFLIGGLWYSPLLFGRTWARLNNLTDEQLKQGLGRIFLFSFLWSFIMALNLAVFLNDGDTTVAWGALAGFLAGFGWIAMAIFIIGLFERHTTQHLLINAGYMTISFVVMGLILAVWR